MSNVHRARLAAGRRNLAEVVSFSVVAFKTSVLKATAKNKTFH